MDDKTKKILILSGLGCCVVVCFSLLVCALLFVPATLIFSNPGPITPSPGNCIIPTDYSPLFDGETQEYLTDCVEYTCDDGELIQRDLDQDYCDSRNGVENTAIPEFTGIPQPIQDTDSSSLDVSISSNVPPGWDLEVIDLLDDSTPLADYADSYANTGISKIVVTTPSGKEAFRLEAVDGIGGTNYCSKVYKFPDTEQRYVDARSSTDPYFSDAPEPEVVTLSKTGSNDFDLLGQKGRIKDAVAYWHNDIFVEYDKSGDAVFITSAGSSFNPACSDLKNVIQIPGLWAYSNAEDIFEAQDEEFPYVATLASNLTRQEQQRLAEILSTLRLNIRSN